MEEEKYPDSLKLVLQETPHENILDSNMFSSYIPEELSVPKIEDPRKTQRSVNGITRHPGYVRSGEINQIFTYIGFIKRTDNRGYREYLPLLFRELNRFLRVFEDVVYSLDVAIPEEIYAEQKEGLENFTVSYDGQPRNRIAWIEKIWKQQKIYLENIDMLVETLKLRGQVFDFGDDPLCLAIVAFCKNFFSRDSAERPGFNDYRFVANCCAKAVKDNEPKTIWSGDTHISRILKALYGKESGLVGDLPEIYLRASYAPRRFARLFP